jgi:putative copper resistance protein D
VSLVLEVADTDVGQPVTIASIRDYVGEIASGQALVIVACCALLYVVIGVLAVRRGEDVPVELRITVAMFTLLPLPVTGHAAGGAAGWHDISLLSMELHVLGAVSWTGGLLAVMLLAARERSLLADALPRFSALATVCVFATAATGLFNGWYVLDSTPGTHWYTALVTTGYGWILLGKLACVTGAGLLGAYTRFTLLPRIARRQVTAVLTWATVEIAVLGTAFGLAAVLVRAPVLPG